MRPREAQPVGCRIASAAPDPARPDAKEDLSRTDGRDGALLDADIAVIVPDGYAHGLSKSLSSSPFTNGENDLTNRWFNRGHTDLSLLCKEGQREN